MEQKQKQKKDPKFLKYKQKKKPSLTAISVLQVLTVSLGRVMCPNPDTGETSIVHSC